MLEAQAKKNVSAVKLKIKNAKEAIEVLSASGKKAKALAQNPTAVKIRNFLDSHQEIQKILVLNSQELDKELLRKVYGLGFDGVYIEGSKVFEIENILDIIVAVSKEYPKQFENFVETSPKTAKIYEKRFQASGIIPAVKIIKNANADFISSCLEPLTETALEINSVRSGDELSSSQDRLSTVFLRNTSAIGKDKSDIGDLKENKLLKIYNSILKTAGKSKLSKEKIDNSAALVKYAQPENFQEKDFKGLKSALRASGISENSPLLSFIDMSDDSPEGYAAAKAYIKALIANHYQTAKYLRVKKAVLFDKKDIAYINAKSILQAG
jgi:hypothetical protein